MLRPHALAIVTAAIGAIVTVLVVTVPWIEIAYRGPSVHVALETASALIALLAAYLVLGRFQRGARLSDLTLFCALAIFGLTNVLFATIPAAFSATARLGAFATWAPLLGALLAAAILAVSAFAPQTPVKRPRLYAVGTLAIALAAVSTIAAVVGGLSPKLPPGIDPSLSPGAAGYFAGDKAVLAAQLVATLLFAAAAIGFLRRAQRGDALIGWFAAGSILGAFARLNYFLFPSIYSEWVSTGDVLRLGFYLLLLVGAATEIRGYWLKFAENAVLEERQRIARELHDGLAQELAFVVAEMRRLPNGRDLAETLVELSDIAQRALDDSRRAIVALSGPVDEPLAHALADTAEEMAARMGVRLSLDLEEDVDVSPATREALLRITREALTNAARHGHARTVQVHLAKNDGTHLEIIDDGVGFDSIQPSRKRHRFGLISMRERARALGGELRVASRPGTGTKIEVVLPSGHA